MPINPLPIIEKYESGGRNVPNYINDSTHTASGYFQITNSTHNSVVVPATGLPKVGPGTNYPNGVMDLSREQQEQAASTLFEKNGFSDWACVGCNSKIRDYVASQGGESAFALNGDTAPASSGNTSTNAGDVAGDGSSGLPAISFTSADGSASSDLPAVSENVGPLAKPFSWAYDQLIGSTQQIAKDDIYQLQTAVSTYADGLITLALVCLGIRSLLGRYIIDRYAKFVLTVCILIPFIAVGSPLYQSYVVDPVMGLPSWWQGYLGSSDGVQLTGSNPAGMLDHVYNQTYVVMTAILKATPLSFYLIVVAIALEAAWIVIVLSLTAIFVAYAILTLLALIMLVIGPVCIPFVLFAATSFIFRGWIIATATLVLSMLAVDIVLTFFLGIMTKLMSALTVTGTATTDMPSFYGAALILGIMGFATRYVPRLVERIGGGVGVSMEYAAHHMSGGPMRSAAGNLVMMPVNAARRFTGGR